MVSFVLGVWAFACVYRYNERIIRDTEEVFCNINQSASIGDDCNETLKRFMKDPPTLV